MAIYTYYGNKRRDDFSSRIQFSTGKDIILGESLDLTAQETTEATVKLAPYYDIRSGTVAVTINYMTFPPVRIYRRSGTVAVSGKPYQKS